MDEEKKGDMFCVSRIPKVENRVDKREEIMIEEKVAKTSKDYNVI